MPRKKRGKVWKAQTSGERRKGGINVEKHFLHTDAAVGAEERGQAEGKRVFPRMIDRH